MFRISTVSVAVMIALISLPAISHADNRDNSTHGNHGIREREKDKNINEIVIRNAWARVIITSRPGAAFMRIENSGDADKLIAVKSPVAERVKLHTHEEKGGVFRMRAVEALEVPANGTLELKSGGDHVMLFGLDENIRERPSIPLTLVFENGGEVTVDVPLKEPGGKTDHHDGHSGHGTN